MFTEATHSFLMNSSVGIHSVSAEGIIVYANQYELDMLGYSEDEYVGHPTSEFQIDDPVYKDMMKRLGKFECLKNYPARVQGKNEIKYILYNSSVFHQDDTFVHTRCYGIDLDKRTYDAFRKASLYYPSSPACIE